MSLKRRPGARARPSGGGLPAQTGGQRLAWEQLPASAREQVERLAGQPVVAAESQPGGFSEGLAARVRLLDGSGVFVKAAHVSSPAAVHHRREAAISRRLPAGAPVPRLLHAGDDGEWVALVFEEVAGKLPAQPWLREELDRALDMVPGLVAALTPAPVTASMLAAPRLGGWRQLASRPGRDPTGALPAWAADHIGALAALEARARVAGSTLLHGDLYPFNLLMTARRVVVVDWPHAWVGAPFCDVLTLLSSARLSGIDPEPLAASHPLTRGLAPGQVDGFLALHSGFLLRAAVTAGPGADPDVIAMMTALGRASVQWLRDRWPAG